MIYVPQLSDDKSVSDRINDLMALNEPQMAERARVRDLMNSRNALTALLGTGVISDPDQRMPIANLILRGMEVLGRKIGHRPDLKVDPPVDSDLEAANRRAEKKARIVEGYDEVSRLELMLPQVGRWLPGYGFAAAVVKACRAPHNPSSWVPKVELRDPIHTYPGEWGAGQDPRDLAVAYRMTKARAAALYPQHAEAIRGGKAGGYQTGPGGAVMLTRSSTEATWASQNGGEIDVVEYYDERGCWWMIPSISARVGFEPNLCSSPMFKVAKRFAFDELVGSYDQAIGVMAQMTRLALLHGVAVEDAVMSEIVVVGQLVGDEYKRGRNGFNRVRAEPGAGVFRGPTGSVPFETFSYSKDLERQLRMATGHAPQDDGQAGAGWTTGKGLEELASASGLEVAEYQKSLRWWLQDLDSLRLEFDEKVCDGEKQAVGTVKGAPFAEKYTPSKDIKGDYRTRRVYGAMSGLDDSAKLVGGLQMLAANVIDTDTLREQIDGLDNHQKIKDRLVAEKASTVILESLLARAGQGDPEAEAMAAELLPPGNQLRVMVERRLEAAAAAQAQQPAAPVGPAGMPDVATAMRDAYSEQPQTVLSRATLDGVAAGSQVVASV